MKAAAFASTAALPPDALALLARAEAEEFQLGRAWFGLLAESALPDGARPVWLLATKGGRALLLLPLLRSADGRLAALTAPYTCIYRPVAAPDGTAAELAAAARVCARFCRTAGPLRLDALDEGWPGWAPLLRGFRAGGMLALRFAHFGNWHESVAGRDWSAYLEARPGELRTTIRRKLARAERDAALRFALVTGGADLAAGIAAYEAVHARSWKEPEPFPRFAAALIATAAAAGALRLALLWQGEIPVAAQIWTLAGGTATVHKLAHDEAARAISPGTVLTAWTIRHLIERERVATLDFGRGDDPYKRGWAAERRQRTGLLLCPPWRPDGALAIARHLAGMLRRHLAARAESHTR